MPNPSIRGLFDRHHLRIYRFALRVSGDPALAEEVTQEVFVKALRSIESYRERGRESAWLFRIARNLLIDRARKLSTRPEVVELGAVAGRATDPLLRASLEHALAGLDEEHRSWSFRARPSLRRARAAAAAETTTPHRRNRGRDR